jgi:hypothetical protein
VSTGPNTRLWAAAEDAVLGGADPQMLAALGEAK